VKSRLRVVLRNCTRRQTERDTTLTNADK